MMPSAEAFPDHITEAELIRQAQQGHRASFDELVRRHYALAFNLAFRLLGNHDQAADATQTAFVRAYNAIGRFRLDAAFSTWLYRIITNVCLDRMREQERNTQSLTYIGEGGNPTLEDMEIPDSSGDPAPVAEQRERQQIVQDALLRLSPDHRAVLVMYDLGGQSYEDIAVALSIPLGTVKSRLNRARLALKDELMAYRELFR